MYMNKSTHYDTCSCVTVKVLPGYAVELQNYLLFCSLAISSEMYIKIQRLKRLEMHLYILKIRVCLNPYAPLVDSPRVF